MTCDLDPPGWFQPVNRLDFARDGGAAF